MISLHVYLSEWFSIKEIQQGGVKALLTLLVRFREWPGYYLLLFEILFSLSEESREYCIYKKNEAPWMVFKVNSSLKPMHISVTEQRTLWGPFLLALFVFPC